MSSEFSDRGVVVTLAGTGINLALGVLYAWSIFKGEILRSIERGGEGAFQWELASLNDPYALCCLVFACTMVLAGKCQDSYGPRLTAMIGGVLVGIGFIWLSQTTDYWSWLLGFGVLVGTGIAFGYSAATPAAMKWFPPNRTGLVAGIVVSGFGLASVYIAPLATYLMASWGMRATMLFLGIGFLLVVSAFSLLLKVPPPDYRPGGFVDRRNPGNRQVRDNFQPIDDSPRQILTSTTFWAIWGLYFIGAGAGLMVIGSVAGMAKSSMGEQAFIAVVCLAIGNAAGRVTAGSLSDLVGRKPTLVGMFLFQALLMFAAVPIVGSESSSALLLVILAALIGFNYGSNLALFPSFTKDLWGISHFGLNYGMVFTAWGIGGFVMSRISQSLVAETGSYTGSFITAGVLLLLGLGLLPLIHDRREHQKQLLQGD